MTRTNKKALYATASMILNKYDLLARVSDPHDEAFLHQLLGCHPEFLEKAKGLAIIKFEIHPYIRGERTFYFYRSDGSRDNFSIRKCIRNAACG